MNLELNNKIIDVQEMLMRQMKRLDNNDLMKESGENEIARSNALTNSATTYLKTINTSLRIIETSIKNEKTTSYIVKKIGMEK